MNLIEFQEINEASIFEGGQNIRNVKIVDFNNTKIGGGSYVNNEKHGFWVEIEMNKTNCEIKCVGNYYNGKRNGQWEFYHNDELFGKKEYDQNGHEIKNSFNYFVVYHPVSSFVIKQSYQLYQNKKIGQFSTFFKYEFLEAGNYDFNENKVGFWKEMIPDSFRIDATLENDKVRSTIDVVYTEGFYENGKKQGRWESRAYQNTGFYDNDSIRSVAFGNYDQGLKTGTWEEPYSYNDEYGLKETISGGYLNDKKHGKWQLISTIAPKEWGGNFDNGLKTGIWNEFYHFGEYRSTSTFDQQAVYINSLIQEKGKYQNNYRVGTWNQSTSKLDSEILFLNYNNNGQLHGEQKVLSCIGKYKCYLIKEEGYCENGQRINRWSSKLFHYETQQWKDYSEGLYQNGKKSGFWTEYENFDIQDSEGISTIELPNETLFIEWKGNYVDGQRTGEWTWSFVELLPEQNLDQIIYQVSGSQLYGEDKETVTGKFILFKAQFAARHARFKYFDVFTGKTKKGLRDGQWDFVYAEVQQTESILNEDSIEDAEIEEENNASDQDNDDEGKSDQSEEDDQPVIQQIELKFESSPYERYDNGIIIQHRVN